MYELIGKKHRNKIRQKKQFPPKKLQTRGWSLSKTRHIWIFPFVKPSLVLPILQQIIDWNLLIIWTWWKWYDFISMSVFQKNFVADSTTIFLRNPLVLNVILVQIKWTRHIWKLFETYKITFERRLLFSINGIITIKGKRGTKIEYNLHA